MPSAASNRVNANTARKASAWVKEKHPAIWDCLREEAWSEERAKRPPEPTNQGDTKVNNSQDPLSPVAAEYDSPLVGGLWSLVTEVIDSKLAEAHDYGPTGTVHAYIDCWSVGSHRENTRWRAVSPQDPIHNRCGTCVTRLAKGDGV